MKGLEAAKCLVASQEEDCVFIVSAQAHVLLQWLLGECQVRLMKTMSLMCSGWYTAPDPKADGFYLPTSDY